VVDDGEREDVSAYGKRTNISKQATKPKKMTRKRARDQTNSPMIRLRPAPIALLAPPAVPVLRNLLVAPFGRARWVRVRVGLDVEDRGFGVEKVDLVVHPDPLVGDVGDGLEVVCAHGPGREAAAGGGVGLVAVVGVGVVPASVYGRKREGR
jgi:hypothetical protein